MYEPSQFSYKPNRESNVGKWFSKHNLPIISGASGSAIDNLALIFSLIKPTHSEIQLLMISLAATLIAKGHHSYFEIIILLDGYGFSLKSVNTLFDFYEQTLPRSIILSESYLRFTNSLKGAKLLEGISDDLEFDDDFQKLPILSIGHNVDR